VRSRSSDQLSFLVLNNYLETFPATEDSTHNRRLYLGCPNDNTIHESDFLDVFCSDLSQGSLFGKAPEPCEDLAHMFGVLGVFDPHLGGRGRTCVGDVIVRFLDKGPRECRIKGDEVVEVDYEGFAVRDGDLREAFSVLRARLVGLVGSKEVLKDVFRAGGLKKRAQLVASRPRMSFFHLSTVSRTF
jgi:hypothetical protein